MCGIVGMVTKTKMYDKRERINNMIIAMSHRGPDAKDIIVADSQCILGHLRLSIIDLQKKSNQPMVDISGRYIVSYNGEIVNYKEIKKELKYPFQTQSDTEVILAAVSEYGLDWLLERAVGMYAFILYDKKERKIFLVRDRFGIKPLLYCLQSGTLIIASEIQGLLKSGLIYADLNEPAIDEYLGYRYIREPYTFFQGIYQVPHATYLIFDENLCMTSKQYYSLPSLNFDKQYNENILLEELNDKMTMVINRWLISDVKIGSYLSGGVDSSLLTAYMSRQKQNLDTYTIGFNDEKTNEFQYAGIVADQYQTNHRTFITTIDEFLMEDDCLPLFKGAPLGVPNESLLSIMTTRLSKDITVVISGEGADELFGGYGRIFRSPFDFKNHKFIGDFFSFFIKQYEYVPRLFRDKYLKTDKSYRNYFDGMISKEFKNYREEENVFRFFHNYHIQGLLQRLDTCTMKSSIESRPPFLDHELINFVYTRIPYELKLRWKDEDSARKAVYLSAVEYSENLDVPKYILKKLSERYLPSKVIYRKKQGFPVPLIKNLVIMHKQLDLLKNCEWIGFDDSEILFNDIKKFTNPGQILWMLLNIEKFKRLYFKKDWRY
jgi:asparagine synthase (glutamine-hydrolysing)